MTEPWIERWQEGRIGWHEPSGNASLRKFWKSSGRSVLVPMCGKSVDLRWLADAGNRVVGIELSAIAVETFFAEQALDFSIRGGALPCYEAKSADIKIYCGDIFTLSSIRCDAHYDRGALGALPPAMRPAYAAHVSSLLAPGAQQLVITLDYDNRVADGPPFALADDEVLGYWGNLECVDAYNDIENAPPKFLEAGLETVVEKVWRTA